MQKKQNNEDFQEKASLHVLGALLPMEERAFLHELDMASDEARVEVAELSSIVSQLGLSAPEASPSESVRERLLEQIAKEPQAAKPAAARPAHYDVFANDGEWTEIFEGVFRKPLFVEPTNGYVTFLLKMNPGSRVPDHKHKGNEQCLIVAGEFRMNDKAYRPGDFTVAFDGTDHLDLFSQTGATLLIVSPPDYDLVTA